jgi:hypothetical protein
MPTAPTDVPTAWPTGIRGISCDDSYVYYYYFASECGGGGAAKNHDGSGSDPSNWETRSPTATPTVAPSAAPTNIGDTHTPTASPTPAPTIDINNVLNWELLKTACGSSGTVTLSDDFVMGTYTSQIDFSGKQLVIIGNNKTLDAGKDG